jgi:signal recognition particle subunit SRP54
MVERSLLEADVSITAARVFMDQVTQKALGQKVLLSLRPADELVRIVYDELVRILGPVDPTIQLKAQGVTVLMLCGLQGSGKTTTCGKLARLLLESKTRSLLVAADLQRPAAIEQLHVLGRQLNIPVFSEPGAADPVKVCQKGIEEARKQQARVCILDTAGRLSIDQELMDQLSRIDRQVGPDQVYLVVDGMTGQDAVNSAAAFNKALELDGVIMTKLDGDARGGALLSVKHATGVPIKFIGSGEHLDALEPFRPEGMAGRILQMGDIVAAAREAHRIVDEKERVELERKLATGDFTLDDFKQHLEKMAKPGLMGKMMGLIPGMGQFKEALENEQSAGKIGQTIGAINSMTPAERKNPKLIDMNRRLRIAKGAGVEPHFINQLTKEFEQMKPIMKLAASGTMGDKLQLMRQLQSMGPQSDPSRVGGMGKVGTGKRLTSEEKARLKKQREKELRKRKRGK